MNQDGEKMDDVHRYKRPGRREKFLACFLTPLDRGHSECVGCAVSALQLRGPWAEQRQILAISAGGGTPGVEDRRRLSPTGMRAAATNPRSRSEAFNIVLTVPQNVSTMTPKSVEEST